MVASFLGDKQIALIDGNTKIGLKILASGGGKCNVTNQNVSTQNYLCNADFAKYALQNFTSEHTLSFLEKFNIPLELRNHGQYFCKNSARDIVELFKKLNAHATLFLAQKVKSVCFMENFIIETDSEKIFSKKCIVASGGVSYATLGATDIGYKIAKIFGHTIKTPAPALVGLCVQKEQFWMKNLSGISFNVKISINEKSFTNELLFTHKGISGPAVLSTSLYWQKGKIIIDFLPDTDLKKLLHVRTNKQISSLLPLPKRFIKEFLASINLQDKSIAQLTNVEIASLQSLKNYIFAPAGNFGYTKAEITKGGVCTDEIDAHSFESKLQKRLYFIGEVLDVSGELGGYNLQWAFASAVACANHV
ncbi:MAG: aminoacetone oxidase family FAD-binding enzyme [Sulfurospirillum sp.]|nr:aminoacetone oxidase family FAD-binding enzyme [Sulfurospirillum sp.]